MTRVISAVRTMPRVLCALAAIAAVSWPGTAQAATATANATVNLTSGLAITKVEDLNFGTAAPGLTGGTIVMTPGGARSSTGSVKLSGLDAGTAASFTVSGDADSTYTITLPLLATLSDGGLNTVSVTNFTSTPSGTGTLTGGTQTVNVGGTLNVGLAQAQGVYSGTFDVTVEYN